MEKSDDKISFIKSNPNFPKFNYLKLSKKANHIVASRLNKNLFKKVNVFTCTEKLICLILFVFLFCLTFILIFGNPFIEVRYNSETKEKYTKSDIKYWARYEGISAYEFCIKPWEALKRSGFKMFQFLYKIRQATCSKIDGYSRCSGYCRNYNYDCSGGWNKDLDVFCRKEFGTMNATDIIGSSKNTGMTVRYFILVPKRSSRIQDGDDKVMPVK